MSQLTFDRIRSYGSVRSGVLWASLIVGSVLAVLLPLVVQSSYTQHLLVMTLLFLILTSSYNLAAGSTGYLSLAHATFFGIGAYTSAILTAKFGSHPVFGVLGGMIVTSLASLLLGWIALRQLRGFAFSIVTLGFAVTVNAVVVNWPSLTGGPGGLPGIPRPAVVIFDHTITLVRPIDFYYLGILLAALSVACAYWIQSSRIGRALHAVRDNERLASAIGVNTLKYKVFVFAVGAIFAGIAGSFYAHYFTVVTPDILWIYWITALLTMLVIGGPGSLIGVSISTVLLVFIPESLRFFQRYREFMYGVMLLLSIRFIPQGIGGILEQATYRRRLARWRSLISEE